MKEAIPSFLKDGEWTFHLRFYQKVYISIS